MPNRKYLPSINFSVPFARWSHFYVSIDWPNYTLAYIRKPNPDYRKFKTAVVDLSSNFANTITFLLKWLRLKKIV
jgi:hypothetical protein